MMHLSALDCRPIGSKNKPKPPVAAPSVADVVLAGDTTDREMVVSEAAVTEPTEVIATLDEPDTTHSADLESSDTAPASATETGVAVENGSSGPTQ